MKIALPVSLGDPTYIRYIRQIGASGAIYFMLEADPVTKVVNHIDLVRERSSYADAGLEVFSVENLEHQPEYYDPIILGWPDRDRQIERIAASIRVMGEVGIRFFGYHWMVAHKPTANPVFCTSMAPHVAGEVRSSALSTWN